MLWRIAVSWTRVGLGLGLGLGLGSGLGLGLGLGTYVDLVLEVAEVDVVKDGCLMEVS